VTTSTDLPPPLPPRKPSGGVVALGIISIIYSSTFYFCCGFSSIAAPFFAFQQYAQKQGLPDFQPPGAVQAYSLINGAIYIMLGILLIIGGIGLLRLRPWGRSLSISTAVALIVWAVIALAINLFLAYPAQTDMMGDEFTPEQRMIVLAIAGILGAIFQVVYPIVLLICLNLKQIKRQFEPEAGLLRIETKGGHMTSTPQGKPEVKIADWLKEGWNIFTADIGVFVLASLIYNLINATCIGGLILYGPLTCGMYLMVFDRMRGTKSQVGRLFDGFNYFGESFFVGFFFFLLVLVGATLAGGFIGIVILLAIQTIFLFSFQLVADRRKRSIEAISSSFEKVRENFPQFALFAVVLLIIHIAGYVTVIGWLVTTPFALASAAAAYRDVFGFAGTEPSQTIIQA
jgi:hypothetical protein